MPIIPQFENDVAVRPQTMPTAPLDATAAPFAAVAEGAGAVGQAMQQWEDRYAQAKRASDASNAVVGLGKQLDDVQHKWSLVPDRAQALAGYNADVSRLQKQVGTIADPLVRAHVAEQFGMEALARGDEVGRQSFALESSAHRGQLDQNLTDLSTQAARAPNDAARAVVTDNANAAIAGAAAGGWIAPEEAAQHRIKWASDVQAVHVRDQMATAYDREDTDAMGKLATQVLDPANYPGMTQDTRVGLANELSTKAYRLELRLGREEAHRDAMADRDFHRAQAHNEATLLARIDAGAGAPSDLDIQGMADRQQISAGGVEAIEAAKNRQDDGHDDPNVSVPLLDMALQGEDVREEAHRAYVTGHVSKTSWADIVKTVDAKNARGDSATDKSNYSVLKTAMSGDALASGSFMGPDRPAAAAKWAQAQGEWSRRVNGGEDSTTVLTDMMAKYASPSIRPSWLAPTRYGTPQSSRDVNALAVRLAGDVRAKRISQGAFEEQAHLLTQYRDFWAQEERRAAAARPRKGSAAGIAVEAQP